MAFISWHWFIVCSLLLVPAFSLPISCPRSLKRFSWKFCDAKQNLYDMRGGIPSRLVLFASAKDSSESLLSRRNLLAGFGAVVLVAVPLVEAYSRAGSQDFPQELFPSPKNGNWGDVEHATLVFHGSGGQDQYTDALMEKLKDPRASKYSSMVEWSQFSTNIFQASFNGQRIGRKAAAQLMRKAPNLKSIHFIGISVGAFAADAATSETKLIASGKDVPFVQLTLLDPFTQRGIFDFGYGARTFGNSADYVEQYLNTDDPVPSTNSPLKNTVCYDITNLRPEEIFGHDWPVAYYARFGHAEITEPQNRLERGKVITLKR